MSFLSVLPVLLFIALGLVMFGLGLSLTVGDFTRLLRHPRAVVLALVLQVLVLPAACYALIALLGVAPLYAVGLIRATAGLISLPALLLSSRWGSNAAIHLLRGIGIVSGIHGYRHDEYAKSRLEQERSAT